MVSTAALQRMVSLEPSDCNPEGIENIILAGQRLLELGEESAEVHTAIARACMFLDWPNMNYETALTHLDKAIEIDPRNLKVFDFKRLCIQHLYRETDDDRYIVEWMDMAMKKADILYDNGPVQFMIHLTEDEFRRGFHYDPNSRGMLFFRLSSLATKLTNEIDVDFSEIVSISRRAHNNYPDDNFINPVIHEIYNLLDYDLKRSYRKALPGFEFKQEKKVIPLFNKKDVA